MFDKSRMLFIMVLSILFITIPTTSWGVSITYQGFTFTIIDEYQVKYPELVDLILTSESIDNAQKQEWLDKLPYMTNQQIDRLFNILMKERIEIERLNLQFQKDVLELNKKHLKQWVILTED